MSGLVRQKRRNLQFFVNHAFWIIDLQENGVSLSLYKLVKFSSGRDPVVYNQKVEHLFAVIVVDCGD